MNFRTASCWVLSILMASSGIAQKEGVVRESASATVIEVPINVIGKDGKPVRNLTAADFEIFDDGVKQTITGFEAVDLQQPVAPSSPLPAAAVRHWLLVFDLSNTSPTSLIRARDGAKAFVQSGLRESDLAAVATLSIQSGWTLLVNFTRDRFQLTRAIDTLGLPRLIARAPDPLAFALVPPGLGSVPADSRAALVLEDLKDLTVVQKGMTDDLKRGQAAEVLKTLGGLARTLDSVRGKKHVLLFSEGFESRLVTGDTAQKTASGSFMERNTTVNTSESAVGGEVWRVDSDARFGSTSSRSLLAAALAEFKRSDTMLDTVDTSGLRGDTEVSGPKPGSGTDALFTMAAETDGDFIRNANALGGALDTMANRSSYVYVLAFQPKSQTQAGRFHALRVRVTAPGARVLARSGYFEPRAFAKLSPLERVLASGDLLTGGARGNSLPASLLALPALGTSSPATVPILLEVPAGALPASSASGTLGLQVYAYANDAAGTLTDFVAQELSLDLPRVGATLAQEGLRIEGMLSLPPGEYTLRALVRETATGRAGVARTALTVPAIPGGAAMLLPPLFEEPASRGVRVQARARAGAAAPSAAQELMIGGERFSAAASPAVVRGAPVRIALVAYNFGAAREGQPLQLSSEIFSADGKPQSADVAVVRRLDSEPAGGRALLLSAKPDLAPGRYILKVRVSDRVTRRSAEATREFEVRAQ